jgi:hypothetical protein
VLTQAAQATKGITASDILSQWNASELVSVTPKQILQHQLSYVSEEVQVGIFYKKFLFFMQKFVYLCIIFVANF